MSALRRCESSCEVAVLTRISSPTSCIALCWWIDALRVNVITIPSPPPIGDWLQPSAGIRLRWSHAIYLVKRVVDSFLGTRRNCRHRRCHVSVAVWSLESALRPSMISLEDELLKTHRSCNWKASGLVSKWISNDWIRILPCRGRGKLANPVSETYPFSEQQ
jgi:hypothetical protein